MIAAQLLDHMAEMYQEIENNFMLAALVTHMNGLTKNIGKINIWCKRNDKYIPP